MTNQPNLRKKRRVELSQVNQGQIRRKIRKKEGNKKENELKLNIFCIIYK